MPLAVKVRLVLEVFEDCLNHPPTFKLGCVG